MAFIQARSVPPIQQHRRRDDEDEEEQQLHDPVSREERRHRARVGRGRHLHASAHLQSQPARGRSKGHGSDGSDGEDDIDDDEDEDAEAEQVESSLPLGLGPSATYNSKKGKRLEEKRYADSSSASTKPRSQKTAGEPSLFVDTSSAHGLLLSRHPRSTSAGKRKQGARHVQSEEARDWSVVFPGRAAAPATVPREAEQHLEEEEESEIDKEAVTDPTYPHQSQFHPTHDGTGHFLSARRRRGAADASGSPVARTARDRSHSTNGSGSGSGSGSGNGSGSQSRYSPPLSTTDLPSPDVLIRSLDAEGYSTTSEIFSPFSSERDRDELLDEDEQEEEEDDDDVLDPPASSAEWDMLRHSRREHRAEEEEEEEEERERQAMIEGKEHALQLLRNIDVFYEEHDAWHHEQQQQQQQQQDYHATASAAAPATSSSKSKSQAKQEAAEAESYEQLLALAPSALSAGMFSNVAFRQKRGKKRHRSRRHQRRVDRTALEGGEAAGGADAAVLDMLSGDYSTCGLAGGERLTGEVESDAASATEESDDADTCRSSKRSNTSRSTVHTHRTSAAGSAAASVGKVQAAKEKKKKGKKGLTISSNVATAHGSVGVHQRLRPSLGRQHTSTSTVAGPYPDVHQQQPRSTGQRVIGAILRKVFDLEPDVLDAFLSKDDAAFDGVGNASSAISVHARAPLQFGFGHGVVDMPLDYTHSAYLHSGRHRFHHHHLAVHALAQIDESQELQQGEDEDLVDEDDEGNLTHITIRESNPSSGPLRLRSSSTSAYSSSSQSNTHAGEGNKNELLEGLPEHLEPTTLEALNAIVGGMPFRIWNELVKRLGLPILRTPQDSGTDRRDQTYYDDDSTISSGRSRTSSVASLGLHAGSPIRQRMVDAGSGLPAKDERDILPKAWRGQIHPAIAAMHSHVQEP